jgi:hypothetical protein
VLLGLEQVCSNRGKGESTPTSTARDDCSKELHSGMKTTTSVAQIDYPPDGRGEVSNASMKHRLRALSIIAGWVLYLRHWEFHISSGVLVPAFRSLDIWETTTAPASNYEQGVYQSLPIVLKALCQM